MDAAATAERIGPNAIIRVAEAIHAFENRAVTNRVFMACGLAKYLADPPTKMVEEREVAALHRELRSVLGTGRAQSVAWLAGRQTADYLLANRIPLAAQRLLKFLPAAIAGRMLAQAIRRNAWTFVGSGQLKLTPGHPFTVTIANCPLCRETSAANSCCTFYVGTFERLFAVLVHANARVTETACAARWDKACVFEIRWSRGQRREFDPAQGVRREQAACSDCDCARSGPR